MGFMQKNVNVFLLVLVLVVATALAGSSVYYQRSFANITSKHDLTADNLSKCTEDLQQFKFNLEKTMRSLNTTSQDIRRYDELYSTKATELETTQTSLTETSGQLQEAKLSLQEEIALKAKFKGDYEDQLAINNDLEEQNTLLTAQKRQLETSVISYRSQVDTMQSCINSFLSTYDGSLTDPMKSGLDDCT